MAGKKRQKGGCGRLLMLGGLSFSLLFIAALFIAPYFIPWDKLKRQVEEKTSAALRHKVTIGSLRFNLFEGMQVMDIRIANAPGFSNTLLFSDRAATIRYRFLPLLLGKVMVKSVVFKQPQLCIEKSRTGKFNFSDMLPETLPKGGDAGSAHSKKLTAAFPLELLVAYFEIAEAGLVYRDLSVQKEYRIEALNFKLENLTLAGITPVKMQLAAKLKVLGKSYPVSCNANWRLNLRQGTCTVEQAETVLPAARILFAGKIENVFSDPNLAFSGKVNLDFDDMLSDLVPEEYLRKLPPGFDLKGLGTITFNCSGPAKSIPALNLDLTHTMDITVAAWGLHFPVSSNGELTLKSGNLSTRMQLKMTGLNTNVNIGLQDISKTRKLDAMIQGTWNLATLPELVPPSKADEIAGLITCGEVAFQTQASGLLSEPDKMLLDARVQVKKGQVAYRKYGLLKEFNLLLVLDATNLELQQCETLLAGHPLSATFFATGFDLRDKRTLQPATTAAKIRWKLKSKFLDIDALLAMLPQPTTKNSEISTANSNTLAAVRNLKVAAKSSEKDNAGPEPDFREIISRRLTVKGSASLEGVKFGTIKLGRLDTDMSLKQGDLKLKIKLQGYRGKIATTTQMDFKQPLLAYQVASDVTQVDVEPLLNDVVDMFVKMRLNKPRIVSEIKNKLTGRLSGKMQLAGRGTRPQNAKPALTGFGKFTLSDGQLRKFGFQDNLASYFGSEKFRQNIPFDHVVLDFLVAKQKLDVKNFVLESGVNGDAGDVRMNAHGIILFAAAFEDFKLQPRLSPRASQNVSSEFGKFTEILKDDRGWVTVPVILNGAMNQPRMTPDWDWIKAQLGAYTKKKTSAVVKKVQEKISDFLGQQKGKSGGENGKNLGDAVEKAKEQMKNLDLKKLFGQ